MIVELNLSDLEKFREFVLTYPPSMDLKHFFVTLDSFVLSNKNIYHKNLNAKKVFDTSDPKNPEWYPIIKKSLSINQLFNQLDYLAD